MNSIRLAFSLRMHRVVLALISILMALVFNGVLPGERPAFADPPLSGAESPQVVNGDFSGAGAGTVGTPPANHDFEMASSTVGSPPANHNFSNGLTDWTPAGSVSLQSGGPGGNYAQLGSGGKILSSAFTLDTRAQVVTLTAAAVNSGTFQWKVNVYSGPTFATKTPRFFTSCPSTCTNWSTYSLDVMAWSSLGQPIKLEVERFLGDLKVDDIGVGQEILANWTPAAGDKISRETGGPNGAYAKTTTTITSAAFTVDANAQNGNIDFKVDSASGSYNAYVLSGGSYGTETHVLNGLQADSSSWGTKAFGLGDWVGQSIKLKIVPAANTTLLVDRAGIAKADIPGWSSSGTTPMTIGSLGGVSYLKSYSSIYSQNMTLDYSGYYGTTRVNWFRIRFLFATNTNCQGVGIGSTLNVYFNGSTSPFWGGAGSGGGWQEAYFYIYNPTSPQTPVSQTGKLRITGWPSSAPPYACENARAWSPPFVAHVERIDAPPPVNYCSSVGAQADELSAKSNGASSSGVDVVSGNYSRGQTDLSIPGLGVPLRFTRCYSAQSNVGGLGTTGPLGNKWSHNWIANLTEFDSGNHTHVRLPGGGSLLWTKAGGNFVPPVGYEGTLVKNGDGTWTMTTWHKLVYTFDSAGKLTSVKDRNLNTVTLSYDGSGRLSTISAPGSRSLTLGYNSDSRISTLTDSAGRSVEYGYNAATGDLTSVTNVLDGITEYEYSSHLLTQATDPNDHLAVRNTYDSRVRVTQQLDALNSATNFSYSTPGAGATRVTDPKNFQTTHYFDVSMRITDVRDHNGGVTTVTYDSDNNKTSVTDPLGRITSYTYDPGGSGNVWTETDPLRQPDGTGESGSQCGPLGTGNGVDDDSDTKVDDGCPSRKYSYTTSNDIDLETDPLGRQTDYIYDPLGNLTRLVGKDSAGAVKALTCYELDSAGQVTGIVESTDLSVPSDPAAACTGHKTLQAYDAAGNQTCVVNPRFSPTTTCATDPGKKSTFIYDLAGRVIHTTSELINYSRPVRGAAPEMGPSQCGATGTGNGANDDSGDDSALDDGCGSTQYTYDAGDNVLTATDGLGNTTVNTYDAKGILTGTRDANRKAAGSGPEGGSYCGPYGTGNGLADNPADDLVVDDGCLSVAYRYDNADRPEKVVHAAVSPTSIPAESYGYDANGNQTSGTNANRQPVGNPETGTQCGSSGTGDGVNNDPSDDGVIDDGCPSTKQAYDNLNRLQSETNALGRVTSYQYDATSSLTHRTDARGLLTKYFYDFAGRPDYIEHWNGGTPVDTIDSTLDAAGRRTQLTDPTGTTGFAYDALDRVTSVTFPGPKVVSYEYDKPNGGTGAPYPGQRTRITYPDSKYVDYTYLADGSMSTVTDWLTKQTTYTYDDAGRLTKTQYPNTVWTDYTYDAAGRLTSLVNNKPGPTTISSYTYTLDDVGNRTQMVDLSGTHSYQYDALYRLTQVTYPGAQTDTYTYDADGHRQTKNTTGYTINAAGEMTVAGGTSYGYDNNGNQTSRGSDTFTFDHENQLTQTVIAGTTSSSVYNGDGIRMSHTVGAQTTDYTWDVAAGLPVVLQDGTNTYVYGLDLISATDAGGNQTYFLYDGLGSTTDLTDASANTTATYAYDVFGAIRSQTGSSTNHWLFAGEQRDGTENLYYLRARYYDPTTGRFLSRDPIGEGNGYSYAFNNPVNLTDPTRLSVLGSLGIDVDSGAVLTGVRIALSLTPVIGDLNDAIAVATGYDIIWGEKLSMEERALTALGLVAGSGRMWREGAGAGLDAAKAFARGGDDIPAKWRNPERYQEFLAEAQARYPKLAGKIHRHHVDPKYMGGDRAGVRVELDAAYHQFITNEFRSHYAYGQGPLNDMARRQKIMNDVYAKFPMP